jgi:hypothetical protein
MTHEFTAPWWSIEVADGWLSEQENECATFWREDGVGALQISAHSNDSGSIPPEELEDFTKGEFPDDSELKTTRCGRFVGVGIDYVADGNFWRKRWVHEGPLLLFVTYNSDANNRGVEMDAVNEMLATLKPTTDAA